MMKTCLKWVRDSSREMSAVLSLGDEISIVARVNSSIDSSISRIEVFWQSPDGSEHLLLSQSAYEIESERAAMMWAQEFVDDLPCLIEQEVAINRETLTRIESETERLEKLLSLILESKEKDDEDS